MRILVDYRPALRARTGVGEYMHELIRAYTAAQDDEVTVFTSSWKDRPDPQLASALHAAVVDARVPVRVLNALWHRAAWPPVEWLAGTHDVVHAAHPLLIPSRTAAQVITIHDLFFLSEPAHTRAEIRRDYPALAPVHARRADAVITSSHHVERLIATELGVAPDRIYVCPPGAPQWRALGHAPHVPADGYILFIGTLEPRKNIGVLLDAYARLLTRTPGTPRLVLAGRATPAARPWLDRLAAPPLQGHVTHLGYVAENHREDVYAGARLLVLPSRDEGFGLPALEAMSAGVPVIVSNRGSLPEVVGAAGSFVDPDDASGLADAMEQLLTDDAAATRHACDGLEQARRFSWAATAATVHRAYMDADRRRRARRDDPGRSVAR
jgi:glycosyltransferase involved in cell wall biosynthesis